MTDQELKEQPNTQETETPPTTPPTNEDASLFPKKTHINLALWITASLLLLFLAVAGFFMYQQARLKTPVSVTTPPPQLVPTVKVQPSPTPDELAVPTVSNATDLETIKKEIDQLNIASPDSDFKELDSDAENL